ncbi:CtsR family transcriptional regulator [Dehalobacterium formicoaceticum]|uniref:CtsR family transcriptional regulator n=1 Tax=Dehalobacterium formicoaceticum TaxID=51515 RepID=A0ABT1XZ60_9FIRM|nr:CtsR family transcriptional regulator [Dehalobacterium formicoaceticum]MCR6543918.1 CtsR family transcriptional regulator [Dehalobacterium formicoaceticum]
MSILADEIERYLKGLLETSMEGFLEIKRNDLAEKFMCVPSQINYVLETRFSNNQGYHIESRRGGGGFIRIVKLVVQQDDDLLNLVNSTEGKLISQKSGEGLITRLEEEGFLTKKEGIILKSIIDKNTILLDAPERDLLRGRILRSVLISLLREDL